MVETLQDFFSSDSSPGVSYEYHLEASYRIPPGVPLGPPRIHSGNRPKLIFRKELFVTGNPQVLTRNPPGAPLEYPPGVHSMISTGGPSKYLPEVPFGNLPKVFP